MGAQRGLSGVMGNSFASRSVLVLMALQLLGAASAQFCADCFILRTSWYRMVGGFLIYLN